MNKFGVVKGHKFGVMVGRFCPCHNGHSNTIQRMIEDCGLYNCAVVVGSRDEISEYVPYTYAVRKKMIQNSLKVSQLDLAIFAIPDIPGQNEIWFSLLRDIIYKKSEGKQLVFYGGSEEDVAIYKYFGHETVIIDREKIDISGTMIREKIKNAESVEDLVHPMNEEIVFERYGLEY